MLKKRVTLVLMAVAMVLAVAGCNKTAKENEGTTAAEKSEKAGIEFPYAVGETGITVNSLFTSTIPNPDCENESGEDIASLEVVNTSDQFIAKVELTVTLEDGTEISFETDDLPAGAKADIFSIDNTVLNSDSVCKKIEGTSEFEDASLLEDQITITVDEKQITLKNVSDADTDSLVIYCHQVFNDTIFGGLSYSYEVDSIPSGKSVTVNASDCILGDPEVVRIEKK